MAASLGAEEVGGAHGFVPSFEVKETSDAYIFKGDLPGVREQDVDVSLTGNRLTVSGKREAEKEEKDEKARYFSYERSYGTFSRSFTLPEGVDDAAVTATLKDGELTLVLPKKPEVQPRKITLGGKEKTKAKA
jgi:HSP20 family protein